MPMRTLTLSLAGTVLLMLAGAVVAVGAEAEEAAAYETPGKVSGDLQYVGPSTPKTATRGEGRWLQRDYGSYDTITLDYDRLSGTLYHVWNRDMVFGPREGHVEGEVFTGTGAHEGLSALLFAEGYDHHRVEGFVFPGALPEYPDPVAVPTE